jgi:hypothetical protein
VVLRNCPQSSAFRDSSWNAPKRLSLEFKARVQIPSEGKAIPTLSPRDPHTVYKSREAQQ